MSLGDLQQLVMLAVIRSRGPGGSAMGGRVRPRSDLRFGGRKGRWTTSEDDAAISPVMGADTAAAVMADASRPRSGLRYRIVENVRNRGLAQPPEEILYLPTVFGAADTPGVARTRSLVVRVSDDPAAFLQEVVESAASQTSFTMAVLSAASLVALLLGVLGIYGVVSYVVSQRTREIGLRMALVAPGAVVRTMVLRQGVMLAGIGVTIGLIAAVVASRVLETLLYGVSATDPLTYAAVAVLLTLVAAVASWVPAERAAAVEPSVALRAD